MRYDEEALHHLANLAKDGDQEARTALAVEQRRRCMLVYERPQLLSAGSKLTIVARWASKQNWRLGTTPQTWLIWRGVAPRNWASGRRRVVHLENGCALSAHLPITNDLAEVVRRLMAGSLCRHCSTCWQGRGRVWRRPARRAQGVARTSAGGEE